MQISGNSGSAFMLQALAKGKDRQELPGANFALPEPLDAKDKSSVDQSSKKKYDAVQEFQDYMKMTPGERMQYAWLKQHNISKADFDALSEDEKQKLMEQMKREIEEKIKADAIKKSHTDILV